MGRRCILALDQGTTNLKAIVFDTKGRVISLAASETPHIFPCPGWVEQEPLATMDRLKECAENALKEIAGKGYELAAIGVTNQTESIVLWETSTGKPVYNIINWSCQRTAKFCEDLNNHGYADQILRKTGLPLEPAFSASKIRWILDHVPGAKDKAKRGELLAGTLDAWTVWHLTKGKLFVTDVSNASRTMLFNIHSGLWDAELLNLFDIPASILPEIHGTSELYGNCRQDSFGLGVPISGMIGDQQASLFGLGGIQQGNVKITYGTGAFLYMNIGHAPVWSNNGVITTIAWKLGRETTYALEGFVITAGSIIQWLRDGLGIIDRLEESETLASTVKDTHGIFFVPALTGLGAPQWEASAKGTIIGITQGSSKAHIVRAAMEGICFQVSDVVEAMIEDTGKDIAWILADGGATKNNLLMQMQADILGREIRRTALSETTALGAAKMAGLAANIWEEDLALVEYDRSYKPTITIKSRLKKRRQWKRAVSLSTKWGRYRSQASSKHILDKAIHKR